MSWKSREFRKSHDAKYLAAAPGLATADARLILGRREWRFFHASNDHETLIARNKETHDNATPSGNRPMGLTLREYGQAHQSVSEVTELVRVRVEFSRPQLRQ